MMGKKLILCVLTASVLLFTACQEPSQGDGAADRTVDTSEYSEASTSSVGINDDRPVGSEWTDQDQEQKDLLYPGFELDTVEINGVSYRTLTADNGCVITDNGHIFLSPYKNDYSGVYAFTLTYNGISDTKIVRTPIGGYTSGNFASWVPRVFMTDVTGDGVSDVVIRTESYDKDDDSTRADLFVYDCQKETFARIPVADIKYMLSDKYVSDKVTVENGVAHTVVRTSDGKTEVDFEYVMSEDVNTISDITVISYSDYLLVRDGVIYCGVWLGAYLDYVDGYYPMTGNYTVYAAALYVPLVYDADSFSFVAGAEEDIVLVPAKTTINYAAKDQ